MTGSHAFSDSRLAAGRSPRCQAATRTPGGHKVRTAGRAAADVDSAHPLIDGQAAEQLAVVDLAAVVAMVPVQPRVGPGRGGSA